MEWNLEDYLLNKIQISHVYQPALIKVLRDKEEVASLQEIAAYLLSCDVSRVKYYELRT